MGADGGKKEGAVLLEVTQSDVDGIGLLPAPGLLASALILAVLGPTLVLK